MNELDIPEIEALMDEGEPVCVSFEKEVEGETSDLLYCEMIERARHGESFLVSTQRCPAGAYVLGKTDIPPHEYYLRSGRYIDEEAAIKASSTLPRIEKEYSAIRIEPLSRSQGKFDVLFLYLTPERAMRLVQALAYSSGERVAMETIGAASICADCTALPLSEGIGLSFGCKGSRKHSEYRDSEVPLGIGYEMIEKIELGLESIPETRD